MSERLVIEATIPTVQYGNVKPTIELEGDDFDAIRDLGLERIKSISDMVAGEGYTFDVRGLAVNSGKTVQAQQKTLKTLTSELTGTSLFYNDDKHAYTNGKGERYISGSSFHNRFYPPFDKQMIIEAMIKKYGKDISGAAIEAMWKLNNEASTGYGTAIHATLENWFRNRELGEAVRGTDTKTNEKKPNSALSKNPFLKHIVESFTAFYEGDDVLPEAFVSNDEFKLCGRIDLVKIVDRKKKILRIQDYKTDGDIKEKKYQIKDSPFKGKIDNTLLGQHWLQLSFYGFILQRAGWTVEGLDIFWLNPAKLAAGDKQPWETFSNDVVDISEVIING